MWRSPYYSLNDAAISGTDMVEGYHYKICAIECQNQGGPDHFWWRVSFCFQKIAVHVQKLCSKIQPINSFKFKIMISCAYASC